MGTLDPLATGVLPIGVGKASRLFDYLLDKQKIYSAVFEFGRLTDTLDCTGETLETTDVIPEKGQIIAVLGDLLGDVDQVPPKYSAKFVNGKRSYDMARRGEEFTLAPKRVHIGSIELTSQIDKKSFAFNIECGGGTYIRSIARDLGEKLGSLCTMTALDRRASGIFNYDNGVRIEDLTDGCDPFKYLIPADRAVSFPQMHLNHGEANRILNGVYGSYGISDGLYRVYSPFEFLGIGEVKGGVLTMKSYIRE